ncbi:hypothetical protein [Sporisorium scitamineum]|uniref:Pre-mRNA splicing factor ini1 n=1 Tax=Sporisorium scitamineum TaxID=49012 RepID=A0A0F7RSV3_9BASI|nr:hypothetical protein [Sporisorium scitamineum]
MKAPSVSPRSLTTVVPPGTRTPCQNIIQISSSVANFPESPSAGFVKRTTANVPSATQCNFGSSGGKCIICGGQGISDAYYCAECTRLEKDRDGCPKVVNLGASRTDLAYLRKARNQQQHSSQFIQHHRSNLS